MRDAPHFVLMANAIDAVMEGRSKRLIINMPPRYGKTEAAVVALNSRIFAINHAAKCMHLSYSDTLVRKNSRKVQNVFKTPQFKDLFPDFAIAQESYAQNHWETTAGGEFHAVTASSSVTGFEVGQDGNPWDGVMVLDDIIKSKDARSLAKRIEAIDVTADSISTRLNHDDTPVIYIGQRLHEEDPAAWLMNGGTGDVWDVLCLQALSETGQPPEHYRGFSHANLIDFNIQPGPLWPWRRSKEALLKIRDAAESEDEDDPRGARTFAAQYQQNPTDASMALYDKRWLRHYVENELPWSISEISARVDTAQKGQAGNDFHALTFFGHDKNNRNHVYMLDTLRIRCGFPDLVAWVLDHVKWILRLCSQSLRFSNLVIEDANVGMALKQSLDVKLAEQRIMLGMALTPRYGNKFDRALEAEAFYQQGRLLVPAERTRFMRAAGMAGVEQFEQEFKTFTEADTHATDDMLDTVNWEIVTRFGDAPKGEVFAYQGIR